MNMEKALWRGKIRLRSLGKPKYWNSVRWLKEDGVKTKAEAREIMFKMATKRVNRTNKHGKKRQGIKAGMKYRMRKQINAVFIN